MPIIKSGIDNFRKTQFELNPQKFKTIQENDYNLMENLPE